MKSLYGSIRTSPVISFSYVSCAMSFSTNFSFGVNVTSTPLAERKREGLDPEIEEFNL
jgi:hypothetical protein